MVFRWFAMDAEAPLQVSVPALLDGVRVDRAVAMLAGISRAEAAALVAAGSITVDGRPVRARSQPLSQGDALSIVLRDDEQVLPGAEPDVPVTVVFADDQVIVVDKAPGLIVHPGAGRPSNTLVGGLLARFPDLVQLQADGVGDPRRPGVVHRLDRGTSGLLMVARTAGAYASLVAQLSSRTVTRRYLALVRGLPADDRGVVEAPIGRSTRDPLRMAVSPQGREARTRYRVLARYDGPEPAALLVVGLDTGRTHQVRVHLAAIGHPVIGDDRYGDARRGPLGQSLPADRLFLHAVRLGFDHPDTGVRCTWDALLPDDLAGLVDVPPSVRDTSTLPEL
jgi:23S rRNA pseudouridine1911/1915/1917 synthase